MVNPSKAKGTAAETAVLRHIITNGFPRTPLALRLTGRLNEALGGCLEWQGATKNGYGVLCVGSRRDGDRRTQRAHRIAWELAFGPIPEGMYVCHRCDNRRCCNPNHLFLGTHVENMADMVAKGRQRHVPQPGVLNGRAKLNPTLAAEIRDLSTRGEPVRDLAQRFGVGETAIKDVLRGKTWGGQ